MIGLPRVRIAADDKIREPDGATKRGLIVESRGSLAGVWFCALPVEKHVAEESSAYGLDGSRREEMHVGDRERVRRDIVGDREAWHVRSIDRQRIELC